MYRPHPNSIHISLHYPTYPSHSLCLVPHTTISTPLSPFCPFPLRIYHNFDPPTFGSRKSRLAHTNPRPSHQPQLSPELRTVRRLFTFSPSTHLEAKTPGNERPSSITDEQSLNNLPLRTSTCHKRQRSGTIRQRNINSRIPFPHNSPRHGRTKKLTPSRNALASIPHRRRHAFLRPPPHLGPARAPHRPHVRLDARSHGIHAPRRGAEMVAPAHCACDATGRGRRRATEPARRAERMSAGTRTFERSICAR